MKIQRLFPDSNYIDGIINHREKDLYQKYTIKGSQKKYQARINCIVKLKDNTFSPVCLIDNEICIIKNTNYQLDQFIVGSSEADFDVFCQGKKIHKKITDKSGLYIWISSTELEHMKFIKVKNWLTVSDGFLKMTFIDEDLIEKFVDIISDKKIFCSHEVYQTIQDLIDREI